MVQGVGRDVGVVAILIALAPAGPDHWGRFSFSRGSGDVAISISYRRGCHGILTGVLDAERSDKEQSYIVALAISLRKHVARANSISQSVN